MQNCSKEFVWKVDLMHSVIVTIGTPKLILWQNSSSFKFCYKIHGNNSRRVIDVNKGYVKQNPGPDDVYLSWKFENKIGLL